MCCANNKKGDYVLYDSDCIVEHPSWIGNSICDGKKYITIKCSVVMIKVIVMNSTETI